MEQITRCQKDRSRIAEHDVWRWMIGLSHALKALHEMKIFHRDMKSANVFLHNTRNGRMAKLGDFNVSTVAKKGLCLTQTGTPYYASPEIWRDMPYDGKSDMWGLGCVMYEAASLRPPFRAEDMEGLAHKVCRGRYKRIPGSFSDELSDIIALLLQVNPRHRPTPAQFLSLPILHKHAVELNLVEDVACVQDLLSTIKVPKRISDLPSFLPLPKYGGQSQTEERDDVSVNFLKQQAPRERMLPSVKSRYSLEAPAKAVRAKRDERDDESVDLPKPQAPREGILPSVKSRYSLEASAKGGRAKRVDRARRVGSQPPARSRPDTMVQRKGQNEIEFHHAQIDHDDCASTGYLPDPQEQGNLLPRIQPAVPLCKALPEGLRLKLPRIASCPGQLV